MNNTDWNYLTDFIPRGKPVSGRWRYEGFPCPYRVIDEARLTTVAMTLPGGAISASPLKKGNTSE